MGIDSTIRRAAFLDRDGVINRAVVRDGRPYPPASVADVELLPGVAGALRRLARAGYLIVVVTNQPDVARGTQSRNVVDAIHSVSVLEAIGLIEQATRSRVNHTYSDANQVGDHICYICDVSKFKSHYPGWDVLVSLPEMTDDMVRAERQRES